MRTTDDDEDATPSASGATGRPGWMNVLKTHAEEWLDSLPKTLTAPPAESSPLARFFAREAATGRRLLKRIRDDLEELKGVCAGQIKQTNELRALMSDLNKGQSFAELLSKQLMYRNCTPALEKVQDPPRHFCWVLRYRHQSSIAPARIDCARPFGEAGSMVRRTVPA